MLQTHSEINLLFQYLQIQQATLLEYVNQQQQSSKKLKLELNSIVKQEHEVIPTDSQRSVQVGSKPTKQTSQCQISVNKIDSIQRSQRQNILDQSTSHTKEDENQHLFQKGYQNVLTRMVRLIIEKVGQCDSELDKEVRKCKSVERDIFNLLLEKYRCRQLSKEEYTKYIVRKAFRYIAGVIRKKNPTSIKLVKSEENTWRDVNDICINACFGENYDEFNVLPFRKDSQIKTMNSKFLSKVFRSATFRAYYEEFLKHFEEIVLKDQRLKTKNLIENVLNLTSHNAIEELKRLKRLPWSKKTLQNLRDVAEQLVTQYN